MIKGFSRHYLVGILILLLCLPSLLFAREFSDVELGQLSKGSVQLTYNGATIPTYKAGDTNYVLTSDLKALGFNVEREIFDNTVTITKNGTATGASGLDLTDKSYSMYNGTVAVEQFETMSLICDDNILIPMAALGSVGTLSIADGLCTFSPVETIPVKATQDAVTNLGNVPVTVTVADLYWDGKTSVLLKDSYTLEPLQTIDGRMKYMDDLSEDAIYLATVVQFVQGEGINYVNNSTLGQVNTSLMQKYISETTAPVIAPSEENNAANETVETGEQTANLTQEEILKIEQLVNSKKVSSQSPLMFYTDSAKNRTYLFKGAVGNWNLLQMNEHEAIQSSSSSARKYSKVNLGKFEKGTVTLSYNGATIPTYKAFNANYISTSDLRAFGYDVSYSSKDQKITISTLNTGYVGSPSSTNYVSKPYTLYTGTVQIGLFESQALTCEGSTFIPVAALNSLGTLVTSNGICTFSPSGSLPVYATQTKLVNLSNLTLNVTLSEMYWNKKEISNTKTYTLKPFETIERAIPVKDKDAVYLGAVIQSVSGDGYSYATKSTLGQVNTALMNKYTDLTTYVAPAVSNGGSYGSPITAEQVANAEAFVNKKGLSSPTRFLVWTNIATQKTYIFQGSKGNWSLLKMFICSTGRDHTPTPKGTFNLTRRVPSFGQNKGYCCKYAYGFIGTTYLYHSIIYDVTGTYLLENKGVLGQKASQGCIRFAVEHAKWFYDTLTPNTTVYID